MKKVLLKDIAEKLGTSVSQVSRALNERGYVAPEIRSKALRLAKKLGYHNMSWKHRKKFAVIVSSFSDFNVHLLREMKNEAQTLECDIAVIPIESISLLQDYLFDGAFVISRNAAELHWHERFKMPLVVINHYGELMDNIKCVFPDADQEVRLAIQHFIKLGHKKIARIRFRSKNTTDKELKRGVSEFFRIAEVCGLKESVCNLCVEDFNAEINAVLKLADQGYTAFLVVMSDWSPQLLQAIKQSGREVPRDISLITYESEISASQIPPMTTLEYNYHEIIKTAFSQLYSEFNKKNKSAKGGQILIPCKMNIRGSTAPYREISKRSREKTKLKKQK